MQCRTYKIMQIVGTLKLNTAIAVGRVRLALEVGQQQWDEPARRALASGIVRSVESYACVMRLWDRERVANELG